jgi:hypothetical protein
MHELLSQPAGVLALAFVVFALAVHRLTKLVIDDYIFDTPRQAYFRKFPPQTSKLGYLATCPWCVSIWAAALLLLIAFIYLPAAVVLGLVLAASSVAGLLEDRH